MSATDDLPTQQKSNSDSVCVDLHLCEKWRLLLMTDFFIILISSGNQCEWQIFQSSNVIDRYWKSKTTEFIELFILCKPQLRKNKQMTTSTKQKKKHNMKINVVQCPSNDQKIWWHIFCWGIEGRDGGICYRTYYSTAIESEIRSGTKWHCPTWLLIFATHYWSSFEILLDLLFIDL